ncbi:MAG: VCBS repeat-containing protein [Planctomycetes bacterium]|nr:VCBS repeat-containing protein [Planctomycetota bacterium]
MIRSLSNRGFACAMIICVTFSAESVQGQWLEKDCQTLLEVASPIQADFFGWTAVPLGDVNEDGTIDFAVSAVFNGNSSGRVTAYSGSDSSQIWNRTESLASAILGFAMQTTDWNNDGVLDVVAGAPFNGPTGGRVWIYDGSDGSTLHVLNPSDVSNDGFGASVATGGDFDGDGIDDIAVGSIGVDDLIMGLENIGRAYVFSGADGNLIASIDGPISGEQFGLGMAFIGDTSDPPDNRDELVVGNRCPDSFFEGEARVYSFNGKSAVMQYIVPNVGMGYSLIGDRIGGGKDVNGDGVPDFTIGDMFLGIIYVFSGVNGSLIYAIAPPGEETNLAANEMIDDITGDGVPDILGGAWGSDHAVTEGGRAFIFSGADGSIVRSMTYTVPSGRLGIEVRLVGDLNNDGAMDFLLGATGGGFNGPPTGRFFVVAGISSPQVPGDLDGDGVVNTVDLLLLFAQWGPCSDCNDCPADLDDDCQVSTVDLLMLFSNWG